jgi:hypothetical protein
MWGALSEERRDLSFTTELVASSSYFCLHSLSMDRIGNTASNSSSIVVRVFVAAVM